LRSDFKGASRIEMSAQSVLQLCGEIKPYLPKLTRGYEGNSGRGAQWQKVKRNVNSRCDRAQILKRRNNANASEELAASEKYLRNDVLPGIREYNQNVNAAVANAELAVNAANAATLNAAAANAAVANAVNAVNSVAAINKTPNNNFAVGGRRRKSRKSKKSKKTRKTRRSRK